MSQPVNLISPDFYLMLRVAYRCDSECYGLRPPMLTLPVSIGIVRGDEGRPDSTIRLQMPKCNLKTD